VKSLVELGKWGCETDALKIKRVSTSNYFEEEDFYPDEL
jgi:hypothetical protein